MNLCKKYYKYYVSRMLKHIIPGTYVVHTCMCMHVINVEIHSRICLYSSHRLLRTGVCGGVVAYYVPGSGDFSKEHPRVSVSGRRGPTLYDVDVDDKCSKYNRNNFHSLTV